MRLLQIGQWGGDLDQPAGLMAGGAPVVFGLLCFCTVVIVQIVFSPSSVTFFLLDYAVLSFF